MKLARRGKWKRPLMSPSPERCVSSHTAEHWCNTVAALCTPCLTMNYHAFSDQQCLGDSSMPLQVLEPLQMACVMDVPRIAEPALGCLHKLVSRPAQPKRVSLCMLMACCHI